MKYSTLIQKSPKKIQKIVDDRYKVQENAFHNSEHYVPETQPSEEISVAENDTIFQTTCIPESQIQDQVTSFSI